MLYDESIPTLTLAWIRLTTTFGYDGLRVTTHDSTQTKGITQLGEGYGVSWTGWTPVEDWFKCYTGTNGQPCGGNVEHIAATFRVSLPHEGIGSTWFPWIHEEESFLGDHSGSRTISYYVPI